MNRASNMHAIHAAVCKEAGSVTLECAREGGYHSTTKGILISVVATETVKAVRLRDVFDEFKIDRCEFLKVDCEGAEYEIFESFPDSYLARVDKIAMEWHGVQSLEERRSRANWLASRLIDRGFKLETYIEYTGFRSGMIRAIRIGN